MISTREVIKNKIEVSEIVNNIISEVKEKYSRSKEFKIKRVLKRRRTLLRKNKCVENTSELVQVESCFGCRLNCAVVVYKRIRPETGQSGLFIYCEELGLLQMYYDVTGNLNIKKNMGVHSDSSFYTNK